MWGLEVVTRCASVSTVMTKNGLTQILEEMASRSPPMSAPINNHVKMAWFQWPHLQDINRCFTQSNFITSKHATSDYYYFNFFASHSKHKKIVSKENETKIKKREILSGTIITLIFNKKVTKIILWMAVGDITKGKRGVYVYFDDKKRNTLGHM